MAYDREINTVFRRQVRSESEQMFRGDLARHRDERVAAMTSSC